MASNVRQNRTLEAYCCLRGLENEVTSDFCLAPFSLGNMLFSMSWLRFKTAKVPSYRSSNSKLHYNSTRIRSSKVAYS